ncbi:hypothetical protein PHJA_000980700 [Phtheirospermum japonicum]|uniref:C2 NT-type domain-containing protein n=1 Tax=Phtheirospermum japonicum TaxID=374723 RepID=A0A830BL88_9LAMI|nr:hypothetical protein PHJA_000980700 [Phtheirospermum japonicum]
MVLGIRSKHRRDASIKVNYTVHVNEIKPWPPSESLRSVQTLLLQWENNNQHSGTFRSTARDSKLVFNESFKLPLTLHHDKKANDKFQKNNLEFSLFSPHKNNNKAKGQLLGTAIINLADYGVIENVISISGVVNLKRGVNSSVQPVLVISVEPVEKGSSSSSPNVGLSKEPSLDGSEIASFTDDEDPMSSMSSSPSQIEKNGYGNAEFEPEQHMKIHPLSTHASFYSGTHVNDDVSSSRFYERSMTTVKKKTENPFSRSYSSSIARRDINGRHTNIEIAQKQPEAISTDNYKKIADNSNFADILFPDASQENESQMEGENKNGEMIERKEQKDEISECKDEWKTRIEMLEEELRETAAIEVGLYSVVAEHGSSVNKVHVPARRISRFYSNACKSGSRAKRASAARAAVSGLVLVAKSCGNDVARLTFWLSNSIMLRAIVSQIASDLPHSNDDLDDVPTFITALEKIESWLFSRIVESLWWQTFTPHMHPTAAKDRAITSVSSTKKACGRRNSLVNHNDQGNFSTELWKKAFKDACERLCPIRAAGHECGCLTVLVRMVMEQLVDRLDTAMFNAILRESAEEMPTDPLSDPITESKVLPIPSGKSSFGAAVELKNSIGNWSRWLTDLFGLEDDTTENSDILGDSKRPKPFKAFRLLHALSDLMMLPFGMLADAPTRKEVCPMLGPTIIKRVLNNHIPDEFCPDPIPQNIIDALDTEEVSDDDSGNSVASFPCAASPTIYSPPSAALLTCVGDVGNQVLQSSRLSSLKKSYTSDDELDELDSPFTSIIPDSSALAKLRSIPKESGGRNVIRYELLREIWKDDE